MQINIQLRAPFVIGLTGSVGMGKTQVGKMFQAHGIPVFEADDLVHELYQTNQALINCLREKFPDAVEKRGVNRNKLAHHLEKRPEDLSLLEAIVHPFVYAKRKEILDLSRVQGDKVIIFSIPLLFETRQSNPLEFDMIILVSAPYSVQKARVLKRPGMTSKKFFMLLSRQMPDALKRTKADIVIPTDVSLEQTEKIVNDIVHSLL